MQTPLHAAAATPSQQRAAAARRERERKIAARAHPDSANARPSAPASPPAEAVKAWAERQKQIHAPIKTWFWIVDEVGPPLPLKLSIEEIQTAVERHCDVRRAELISARRSAGIVRPRQIAMFLARHLTLHSLPMIGRKFGNRDHTTVLHAVRRIETLRSQDPKLANDLDAISRALAAQVP
jgi:chromosomal replication initiation ATPase DnaA